MDETSDRRELSRRFSVTGEGEPAKQSESAINDMAPDEADALRLHRFKNKVVALFLRQLGLPPDTIRQPVRTPDFKKIAVGRIMEDAGEPVIPGRVVTWQNPHNLGRGKPVRGRTDWRTVNYAVPANERQGIKQHVISPIIRLNLQQSLLKSGFHMRFRLVREIG